MNILANAKRDLARRQLYSRFYRGPVVTNFELDKPSQSSSSSSSPNGATTPSTPPAINPMNVSKSTDLEVSIMPPLPHTSLPAPNSPYPTHSLSPANADTSLDKKTKKRKRAVDEKEEEKQEATVLSRDTLEIDDAPSPDRAARKAARRARREERQQRRAAREARRAARSHVAPVNASSAKLSAALAAQASLRNKGPSTLTNGEEGGKVAKTTKTERRLKDKEGRISVDVEVLSSTAVHLEEIKDKKRRKEKRKGQT